MPENTPSLSQLQRALEIAEEIQRLEVQLQSVLHGGSIAGAPAVKAVTASAALSKPGPRAVAQRRPGQKRKVSPEVRARLAAAMKARWAAAKKKGLPGPNARR